jgi:hypothetical protein
MDKERKITALERKLPWDDHLEQTLVIEYAIQSVLSVSPSHPRWSSLYWHVYGDCLKPWVKHKNRIGSTDQSPVFQELFPALEALAAIDKAHKGRLRSRVIVRCRAVKERCITMTEEG